jgi:hypothetical protein
MKYTVVWKPEAERRLQNCGWSLPIRSGSLTPPT